MIERQAQNMKTELRKIGRLDQNMKTEEKQTGRLNQNMQTEERKTGKLDQNMKRKRKTNSKSLEDEFINLEKERDKFIIKKERQVQNVKKRDN